MKAIIESSYHISYYRIYIVLACYVSRKGFELITFLSLKFLCSSSKPPYDSINSIILKIRVCIYKRSVQFSLNLIDFYHEF